MKIIIGFFLVLVLLGSYVIFFRERDITNQDSRGTALVAFGDSLIAGVGGAEEGGFVTILSHDIGFPIVNLGKNGDTSAGGLLRIEEIFEHNPKIVLLLLGGNDYLRKVPSAETFANLGQIIDRIHAEGSMVLLLGIRGGLLKDNFEADFEALAREKNVAYVPDVLDEIFGNQRLMSDSIHPNNEGYKLIAKKVRPVLQRLLK